MFDSDEEISFESPQLCITQPKVPLGCGFIVSSESDDEIEEFRDGLQKVFGGEYESNQ